MDHNYYHDPYQYPDPDMGSMSPEAPDLIAEDKSISPSHRPMAATRKSRTRHWPQPSDDHEVLPSLALRKNELGDDAYEIQTCMNSGRNLLAIFEDCDPTPRLKYNIRVKNGRSEKVWKRFKGVSEVNVPVGMTLEQMCRYYPLHVWGDGIRIFMAESWTAQMIYEALPKESRNDGARTRPWNYLQQAMGREADKMFEEETKGKRIINKRKREDAEDDEVGDNLGDETETFEEEIAREFEYRRANTDNLMPSINQPGFNGQRGFAQTAWPGNISNFTNLNAATQVPTATQQQWFVNQGQSVRAPGPRNVPNYPDLNSQQFYHPDAPLPAWQRQPTVDQNGSPAPKRRLTRSSVPIGDSVISPLLVQHPSNQRLAIQPYTTQVPATQHGSSMPQRSGQLHTSTTSQHGMLPPSGNGSQSHASPYTPPRDHRQRAFQSHQSTSEFSPAHLEQTIQQNFGGGQLQRRAGYGHLSQFPISSHLNASYTSSPIQQASPPRRQMLPGSGIGPQRVPSHAGRLQHSPSPAVGLGISEAEQSNPFVTNPTVPQSFKEQLYGDTHDELTNDGAGFDALRLSEEFDDAFPGPSIDHQINQGLHQSNYAKHRASTDLGNNIGSTARYTNSTSTDRTPAAVNEAMQLDTLEQTEPGFDSATGMADRDIDLTEYLNSNDINLGQY